VLNLFLQYKTISLLWFYGFYQSFQWSLLKIQRSAKNLLMRNKKRRADSENDGMVALF
jgi:hypothetical protein